MPITLLMGVTVAKTSIDCWKTDEICQSFKNYKLNNYGTAENITGKLDGHLFPSTMNSRHI